MKESQYKKILHQLTPIVGVLTLALVLSGCYTQLQTGDRTTSHTQTHQQERSAPATSERALTTQELLRWAEEIERDYRDGRISEDEYWANVAAIKSENSAFYGAYYGDSFYTQPGYSHITNQRLRLERQYVGSHWYRNRPAWAWGAFHDPFFRSRTSGFHFSIGYGRFYHRPFFGHRGFYNHWYGFGAPSYFHRSGIFYGGIHNHYYGSGPFHTVRPRSTTGRTFTPRTTEGRGTAQVRSGDEASTGQRTTRNVIDRSSERTASPSDRGTRTTRTASDSGSTERGSRSSQPRNDRTDRGSRTSGGDTDADRSTRYAAPRPILTPRTGDADDENTVRRAPILIPSERVLHTPREISRVNLERRIQEQMRSERERARTNRSRGNRSWGGTRSRGTTSRSSGSTTRSSGSSRTTRSSGSSRSSERSTSRGSSSSSDSSGRSSRSSRDNDD